MSPLTAGLIGVALTLVIVGCIWLVARGIRTQQSVEASPVEPGSADLYSVVDALGASALMVGPHDELLKVNEAAFASGVARGTRIGYTEVLDLVRERRRTGEVFTGPLHLEREPGTPHVDLMCRVIPLSDQTVLVIAEDESVGKRIDAVRRDFVANISHELKTPIGAIGILAEAVEAAKDEPEQVEHFAQRLQRESARLTELVGQIIELSRLQSDEQTTRHESVEVAEIVGEALSRTREAAQSRNVSLIKAFTVADTTCVLGDRWQLSDAVTNLVQNAIAYSDRNARVALTVLRVSEGGESFIEIKVADNGIGISPEDQERIFERFYRVDYGRSRESGGTGLGLSIVRHIVLGHGGSVHVWSKPHQGSTFTIRLPEYVGLPDGEDQEDSEEE